MMTAYDYPTSTEHARFTAVKVTKGRKFRGRGFIISVTSSTGDYGWKHVSGGDGFYYWQRNIVTTETARIWVPELKRFQYANFKYVEDDDSVSAEETRRAYDEFVAFKLDDTVAWCERQKPGATRDEVLEFARNVVRKHNPEMVEAFDKRFDFKIKVVDNVQSTVRWALGLGYGNTKAMRIAYRALSKKGVTKQPAFVAAWKMNLTLHGLTKIADKILAENS